MTDNATHLDAIETISRIVTLEQKFSAFMELYQRDQEEAKEHRKSVNEKLEKVTGHLDDISKKEQQAIGAMKLARFIKWGIGILIGVAGWLNWTKVAAWLSTIVR